MRRLDLGRHEPQPLTLFRYLKPNPFESYFCSGSGDPDCECYEEDKGAKVGAYCKPITRPGRYLREILFLCDSCRKRLEGAREIKIVPDCG